MNKWVDVSMILKKLPALVFFLLIIAGLYPLSAEVERLVPVVVAKLSHQLPAFTQGLAIEDDQLYESTGLYGQSSLRKLDITTGRVLTNYLLPSDVFAEGIAAFPGQIIQLTWKEQKAIVYDRLSFQRLKVFTYSGDGWGLCRDGQTVWMSNGSSILVQRDKETFKIIKTVKVIRDSSPVNGLNDLECNGNCLYANVYPTNEIIRINKETGEVTGVIDASQLLSSQEKGKLKPEEILNGIAYRPKTGTFLLTGKEWPWIFEVQF